VSPVGYVVLTADAVGRLVFADQRIYIGELQAQYVAQDLGADDKAREYFVCSLRPVVSLDPTWFGLGLTDI
jgi:hypothetical protein